MEDSKIIRMPISFTKEDVLHCISCINFVRYLSDTETDDEALSITLDDVEYLERLLSLVYEIMCEVIEASEGSNNII